MLVAIQSMIWVSLVSAAIAFAQTGEGENFPQSFKPREKTPPKPSAPVPIPQFYSQENPRGPDQVLHPYSRTLKVKLGSAASKIGAADALNFILEFPGDVTVDLGVAEVKGKTATITVTTDQYRTLAEAHPQTLAKLNVKFGNELIFSKNDDSQPKIFIGGNFDYGCAHPILLSDYNGTLDTNSSCVSGKLNDYLKKHNVTLFVISTLGERIKYGLKSATGLSSEHTFVVQNVDESSNSKNYDSFYESNEKGTRVLKNVLPTGACIIGIAGDTESVEGRASLTAGIPFFAVNQRDYQPYTSMPIYEWGYSSDSSYNESSSGSYEPICISAYPRQTPPLVGGTCPKNYEKREVRSVKCTRRIEIPGNGGGFLESTEIATLEEHQTAAEACRPHGGVPIATDGTPDIKGKVTCVLTDQLANEQAPVNGLCPTGYIQSQIYKKSTKPKEVEKPKPAPAPTPKPQEPAKPSIDIDKYLEGSAYTHDWCELVEKLEARFNKK